jgi:hypothetical protein
MITGKKCSGCKETKPIECFSKDPSNSTGLQYKCKECKCKESYFDPKIDPATTKKKCTGECGQEKFLTEFSKSRTGRLGYNNHCNDCRKLDRRKGLNNAPKTEGTKICNGNFCKGKEHPKTSFNKDKYASDGLQSICRDCQLHKTNVSYSNFDVFIAKILNDCRERVKKKAKKGRILEFSITKDDVIKLYKEQNGKCAITKKEMTHNALNDRKEGDCHILNPYNISIDRINSTIGYTPTNIRLVGAIINRIRFDLTDDEFYAICKKIANAENTKAKKVKNIDEITESKDFSKYVLYKLSNAKNNAKARELEFDLEEDDIIELYKKQKGLCILTKDRLEFNKTSNSALSIDRINCCGGYTKDNIQLVIEQVNTIRSDLPIDELIDLCKSVTQNI